MSGHIEPFLTTDETRYNELAICMDFKTVGNKTGFGDEKTKKISWIKKALVDTLGIKSADLKDKFFVLDFCGFPNSLEVEKGRKLPYAA